jgi:hypothetical protein
MYIIKDNEGNIDPTLPNYLQESSAIETKSRVLAEWNLNVFENIEAIGNYKNRPVAGSPADTAPDTWVMETSNTPVGGRTWYGFTDYDTTIDGGYTEGNELTPVTFLSSNERQKSLMSLEDCFKRFRPRSGINKLRGRDGGRYILPVYSNNLFNRPRYYPAGKNDNFKYWSSFRTSSNEILGISKNGNPFLIQDAAPFIVYKNTIPTNKIVMKIQTNVSRQDNGSLINRNSPTNKDPFFIGSTTNYKSTPLKWKVQKLNSNSQWIDIYSTTSDQFTTDAGWDGYFQLSYGLTNSEILTTYKNNFLLIGTLSSLYGLPPIVGKEFAGQTYLIKSSDIDKGLLYIHNGGTSSTILDNYTSITPQYGWYRSEESVTNSQMFVTELSISENDSTSAPKYVEAGVPTYREFEYVNGLRIVVNRMANPATTFDLIELSPRLAVDLTDITTGFSLKKYASDLGVSSLPVGQLLASTGSLSALDYKQVFNSNNRDSILNSYDGDDFQFSFADKNLQLKFYEIISRVKQTDDSYRDYYIPLKTMYADGFPQYDDSNRNISINLRDFVFYLESQIAPEIFLTNASTSYIIASLLDSIGFSNYQFKRISGEQDTVIPAFMISPNKTVMQVLQDLAIATQTTMFFDEMNNLIIMSKRYLVPDSSANRDFDIMLYGSDVPVSGENGLPTQGQTKKANIINISSQSNDIYNDGKITYYNRYVKKKSNKVSSEVLLDKYKNLAYEQQVLWSVNDVQEKALKSKNEQDDSLSGYTLTAMALASQLGSVPPYVKNQKIVNNEIDFGDNIYWLARPTGYLYANGEIIKYDAVQYSAGGQKIWISSENDYAKYYSELSLGQKMYPTGKLRIYAEPKYKADGTYAENTILKHGRGQFGTTITTHTATEKELDASWKEIKEPLVTDFQYIYKDTISATVTNSIIDNIANLKRAKMKEPTTLIKNFLGMPKYNVNTKKYEYRESVQASSLLLSGPKFSTKTNNGPSMNYVKKDLGKSLSYDTFGTRIRLLGTPQETKEENTQVLAGSYPLYTSKILNSPINGESGGIGVLTNNKGEGYYYEIIALNYVDSKNSDGSNNFVSSNSIEVDTLVFYRLDFDDEDGILKPTVLFSTFRNIIVDSGKFASKVKRLQDSVEDSIYDLAIKVNKINNKDWRISIYFNGEMIGFVQDKAPVTSNVSENISLFTRGSSQVMFNDVYAIKTLKKKPAASEVKSSSEIFNGNKTSNLSYSQYSLNTLIATGFLSSLSPSEVPENTIYYEEFGTIMRECAYFDVKFDKVYPALRSKIPPQVSSIAQYMVTGYNSTPYRAEFLVFNMSDFALGLGDGQDYTTILNIVGIGYTEEVARELTVDGFYNKKSDFATNSDYSSQVYKSKYTDIKNSRISYGNKAFTIDSPYIQSEDTATELMEYIITRVSKPRKAVAVQVFGMPIIQLGDLVKFSYDVNEILPNAATASNFVVYAIEQDTGETGPSTILYLSEVT